MAEDKEKKRARLLAKASQVIDEYIAWEEKNPRPDLLQIEDIALKLRKEFGQEIAQLAIENQEARTPAPGPRCAQCGQEMRYKGKKRTEVESRTGRLSVERGYYYCPECKERLFPLDRQLRLHDRNWSEGVAEVALKYSAKLSYAEATEALQELAQIEISEKSVWRLTQRWGEALKQVEEKEAEQANTLVEAPPPGPVAQPKARRLGAALDGCLIYIRSEGWKELKCGCFFEVEWTKIFEAETKELVEVGHATHLSYLSHLGGPEAFGWKLWTEAKRRRWHAAGDTQVVADAAAWIWNLVGDYLYDAHQLVDWFHATQHLGLAANLAFGEGSTQAQRWFKQHETRLFQGHADQIARAIAELAEKQPAQGEGLLQHAGYFEKHQHRMNYLEMRSEGWVIGSGMVESGGKRFKDRFAKAGMRWSRIGAERLLPVRTALLSADLMNGGAALITRPQVDMRPIFRVISRSFGYVAIINHLGRYRGSFPK